MERNVIFQGLSSAKWIDCTPKTSYVVALTRLKQAEVSATEISLLPELSLYTMWRDKKL